jgi:hypothetical protein
MMIYLAHPIDFAGEYYDAIIEAAHEAKDCLLDAGASCVYTPADAWRVNLPMSPAIQMVNNQALLASDAVFIIIPEGARSFGVPFEMGVAHANRIPMVYVTSGEPSRVRRLRETSALFAYLNIPIYSDEEMVEAARVALDLARVAKYRGAVPRPREANGDTRERTGK